MAKDYKGYSVKGNEVYFDKEYVRPVGGKYSIDGERMDIWELSERIFAPKEKPAKAPKPSIYTSPKSEKEVHILKDKPKESIYTYPEVTTLRQHSKETIDKIRLSLLANHPNRKAVIFKGVEYPSANQAAIATGISARTVAAWCKSGKHGCAFLPSH